MELFENTTAITFTGHVWLAITIALENDARALTKARHFAAAAGQIKTAAKIFREAGFTGEALIREREAEALFIKEAAKIKRLSKAK